MDGPLGNFQDDCHPLEILSWAWDADPGLGRSRGIKPHQWVNVVQEVSGLSLHSDSEKLVSGVAGGC